MDIIDKLNKEINAGLADPKIKARLAQLGGTWIQSLRGTGSVQCEKCASSKSKKCEKFTSSKIKECTQLNNWQK